MRTLSLGIVALSFIIFTPFVSAAGTWEDVVASQETFSHALYNSLNDDVLVHSGGVTSYVYHDTEKLVVLQSTDGSQWKELVSPGVASQYAQLRLAVNSQGELYIAYLVKTSTDTAGISGPYAIHVKKYDGTSWSAVGGLGASLRYETDHPIELVFDNANAPYIAFTDITSHRLNVAAYKGTSWNLVGAEDFTVGSVSDPQLAFDASNTPYITYINDGANTTATIEKFDGGVWSVQGSLTAPRRIYQLAPTVFDVNGALNVMYKESLSHYDGETFTYDTGIHFAKFASGVVTEVFAITNLGATQLSAQRYLNGTFVLDKFGIPYIAYTSANRTATVARYIGGALEILGTTNGITNVAEYAPIALSPEGLPIVATIRYTGETNSPSNIVIARYFEEGQLCRFYSSKFRGHFYTASPQECIAVRLNQDWQYEGIAYEVLAQSDAHASPVYRFWSDNYKHHFFTTSLPERNLIVANDTNWAYEGIAYYIYATQQAGTMAVHRFWSDVYKGHFYTASTSEKDAIQAKDTNWRYEGVAWWVKK